MKLSPNTVSLTAPAAGWWADALAADSEAAETKAGRFPPG